MENEHFNPLGHKEAKKILDLYEKTGLIGIVERAFLEGHCVECSECRSAFAKISESEAVSGK